MLVGSGYLHTLNLVSLVRVPCWFVLVGSGYLHALNLVSLVRVSSCLAGWKWLPSYLEPRACWFVCPRALLVGSGYLHALKLVSLVRVVRVVTCMP